MRRGVHEASPTQHTGLSLHRCSSRTKAVCHIADHAGKVSAHLSGHTRHTPVHAQAQNNTWWSLLGWLPMGQQDTLSCSAQAVAPLPQSSPAHWVCAGHQSILGERWACKACQPQRSAAHPDRAGKPNALAV